MVKKYFEAEGYVLGNLWGGGQGYYPAKKYEGNSLIKLKKDIRKDFKSGALDSGMGYKSLIGAIMYITVFETVKIKNKKYTNADKVIKFKLGKISESKLQAALGY